MHEINETDTAESWLFLKLFPTAMVALFPPALCLCKENNLEKKITSLGTWLGLYYI